QTLVWYEPNVLFNVGFGSAVGALGDPHAGFAFHDYCPTEPATHSPAGCDAFDDRAFAHALAHVAETGEAILLSKFGATSDAPTLPTCSRVPTAAWCRGSSGLTAAAARPPTPAR